VIVGFLNLTSIGLGNLCTGLLELSQAMGGPLAGMAGLVAGQGRGADAAAASAKAAARGLPEELVGSVDDFWETAVQVERHCRLLRVLLVGCSHRGCTNLSGPSAEGLVSGRKGVSCGGCRVARYCCPACQKEDWRLHRRVCRRLAAVGLGRAEGICAEAK
jgi:hypothetical protein